MLDISMKEQNVPAHLDVEEAIQQRKTGLLTFTIRMNNGDIVDYNRTEYVNVKTKYLGNGAYAEFQLSVKRNAKEEPTIPHDNGERGSRDTLRTDNI